jgi:hypothetical protein
MRKLLLLSTIALLPCAAAHADVDLYAYYGGNYPLIQLAPAAPSAVPEPGTLAILGVGLAGLLAARRRAA